MKYVDPTQFNQLINKFKLSVYGNINEVGGNRSRGLIKRVDEAGTGALSIDELISKLQAEKELGGKTVRCTGTLLIPELGNKVLISTEKQM